MYKCLTGYNPVLADNDSKHHIVHSYAGAYVTLFQIIK